MWLYISAVLGGCFINGSIPLFYELTIETTYPIAEGIPMAVITTSNHVACLLFLAALMIPGIGKKRPWLAFTRRPCGASLTEAQAETFVENKQFRNQTFCVWVVLFDLHNVNRRKTSTERLGFTRRCGGQIFSATQRNSDRVCRKILFRVQTFRFGLKTRPMITRKKRL